MAAVLDLTHAITPAIPAYPGTDPPVIRQASTVERDGFAETLLEMYSHTGTHVDAPAHMLPGAPTLDQLTVDRFIGPACVIDVSGATNGTLRLAALEPHAGLVAGCDFVLLHTGWSRNWGDDRYLEGFPVLSGEAAEWLASRSLKGVGLDAMSADPVGSVEFPNHLTFFRAGMILIENLNGLDRLIGQRFLFSCLPLAFERADGSPVRAVAVVTA